MSLRPDDWDARDERDAEREWKQEQVMSIYEVQDQIALLNNSIEYLKGQLESFPGDPTELYRLYDERRRERNYLQQELSRLRIGRTY